MATLLDVQNLSISFRTYRGILAATHDVTLHVDAGETVGIVGESGCGKSVTAHAVMRLLPAATTIYSSGTITWDGEAIQGYTEKEMNHLRGREMAMVFQDPMTALNPVLSIGSQIREGLTLHQHLSRSDADQEAAALLREVGITSPERRLHQYPHELSGGMRQRCLIAMALACSPRLLFADEPTTALDVTTEAQVLQLLRSLQAERQMAVVLISHNLGVIAQMCRRVYVMYAGCVVEEGPVEAIFDEPAHPYTQGLLASLPDPAHKDKILTGIAGQAPDLFHMPTGCRFYPRCRQAMQICKRQVPPYYTTGTGHRAACWLLCPEREECAWH
ncbi:ABC transporter ATP-binding protein [Megasphaera hominis]|jgi:oligopeptide transport system ATP-binding protein|uniref:ABC transporter ATP-binding protein n=1 Tax=Megasphaera hominis TaxID=159836 RepID=A0ABR6VGF1_9FIRM|nr:ABC transporter ATP-binding protein [Megasphaera hominis]MBC3536218.1 ABC transporter ATP-binding protein [Megasphaera hominis]